MLVLLAGCRRGAFPEYPANYREFAYVTNGAANTVTVLDLVYLRQDKVLQVGQSPSGIAVNPVRNEVYVANAGSGTVTVINTELNRIEATIGVQRGPYSIAVDHDGKRAYTANSGSNSVSVIEYTRHSGPNRSGIRSTSATPFGNSKCMWCMPGAQ